MKKLETIGLLLVSLALAMPQMASAAPVPTVTISPLVIAPGQTMTISVDPNGGSVGRFYWFTKGGSETAIASWGFGCYQFCFLPVTSKYTIPYTWKPGSDYYVKIYDSANDRYIKTNFKVEASSDPAPTMVPTLAVSPQVVAPGQVLTISLETNGTQVSPNIWFTKGTSEQTIWQTSFPCSYSCTGPATANFTIPNWKNGTDYYVKIYDLTNSKYIKVNFTVKR